jgi:hypothetical protein
MHGIIRERLGDFHQTLLVLRARYRAPKIIFPAMLKTKSECMQQFIHQRCSKTIGYQKKNVKINKDVLTCK